MLKVNITPKWLRIGFDISVAAYSFFIVTFINLKQIDSIYGHFLMVPTMFIGILALLGIYGRHKFTTVSHKSILIIFSALLVCLLNIGNDLLLAVEFSFIATPLLICARLFLNVNNRFIATSRKLTTGSRRVLVVGGAGYIGTHVVMQLLAKGYYVRVLDTFMFGLEPISEFVGHKNFSYILGDASNVLSLARAMQDIDTVVHLAGLVGDPACAVDSELTLHTNVVTARLTKDLAIAAGVKRFIFASSCSVYGVNEDIVDETMALNPVSLYAKTKISTENELLKLSVDNFHVTILRFSTVFGHSNRQRFDLVGNLFAAQAYNNKEVTVIGADQWRPFVHVRDLARAVICVLEAPISKVSNEIFNVGDDRLNRTIMGLAEELVSAYKKVFSGGIVEIKNIEMPATDKRNYRVSFDKIRNVLDFQCTTNFHDGFVEMFEKFKGGLYGDFRDKKYSNLAITKELLEDFSVKEKQFGRYTALEFIAGED